jgi:hypothetical protein
MKDGQPYRALPMQTPRVKLAAGHLKGFDSEHARQLFAAEEDGGTAEAECDFEKEGLGELCLK